MYERIYAFRIFEGALTTSPRVAEIFRLPQREVLFFIDRHTREKEGRKGVIPKVCKSTIEESRKQNVRSIAPYPCSRDEEEKLT